MHVAPVNHTEELRLHRHHIFAPSPLPTPLDPPPSSRFHQELLLCIHLSMCLLFGPRLLLKAFNLRCTGHLPSQPPRLRFHYATTSLCVPLSAHLVHTMPSFSLAHISAERGGGGGQSFPRRAQTHVHPRPLPVAPIAFTERVSAARAKNPFCVRYSHINCVVISQSNS